MWNFAKGHDNRQNSYILLVIEKAAPVCVRARVCVYCFFFGKVPVLLPLAAVGSAFRQALAKAQNFNGIAPRL